MILCIECGNMMRLEGKFWVCPCRRVEARRQTMTVEVNNPEKQGKGVADEVNPLAVYDHVCSKCGFGKAQMVSKGVAISDEDELLEMVCGKCGHHDVEDGLKPY